MELFASGAFVSAGQQLSLSPTVQLNDFRALFTSQSVLMNNDGIRQMLNSFIDGVFTISTSEEIAGVYICQGENEFGPQQESVAIAVQGNDWI